MHAERRTVTAFLAGLACILGIAVAASASGADSPDRLTNVNGTIWVANRLVSETRSAASTRRRATSSRLWTWRPARNRVIWRTRRASSTSPRSSARLRRSRSSKPDGVLHRIPCRRAHARTTCTRASVATSSPSACTARTWSASSTPTGHAARSMGQQPGYDRRHGRMQASSQGRTNALYLASDATSEVIALDPRTGDVSGGCRSGRA